MNKVALITGGNSGIGFATAQRFIAEGAQVLITGRKANAVNEAVAQLGNNAVGLVSDTGKMADISQLAEAVRAHHDHLDVLFINAGVSLGVPITQVSEAQYDTQFDINVKGAYFTIQQLLPLMRDGSVIVLNASATVHRGFPGNSVYAATKAALVALARTLSAELLDRRIRVNAISPGPVTTPLYTKMGIREEHREATLHAYTNMVPVKRFGTPEEIASIATFLASDESSFIVGEEIIAGGGIGTL
ncbi:SDR family oxidoreductase [Catalinimonas alkaloidigena]|nr:SDR family oxidoreductase [Catalinimonas alkaloidigena]